MSTLNYIIIFSLIGSVFSLLGGVVLLTKKRAAKTLAQYAAPFAAGALLGAAFLDVLPEAMHEGEPNSILVWCLVGIVGFFLLERLLHWFHHHHQHALAKTHPTISLIILGDTLHNFLDGAVIAAAFLVDVPTGIVTTLAVAAHEIPQEVGDFGLLLSLGMSRKNVLMVNVVSALATLVAALATYALGSANTLPLPLLLGIAAGFFIYIAASDIIPEIHKTTNKKLIYIESILLIAGVLVVGLLGQIIHHFAEV